MIRTNLATRPFDAERGVRGWLGLAILVVLAATALNTWSALHYARSDTELKSQAARDEARAGALRTSTAALRATADSADARAAIVDREMARELIARRAFSWTGLFSLFESTLPADVRITAVRPRQRTGDRTALEISIVARSVDDVGRFLQNLESTGAFVDVLSRDERTTDEGQIEALVETAYAPAPVAAQAPAPPTTGATP